ncbi:restriction endonuclease subunit S [Methanobrevibacter sp. UBA412]|uniref:restriction endonuclease subunit S n=1 Tax=Methanobrevibacter sp. UBA412 TaxID=1915486 RepID=UPI0039B9AD5B
MNFKEFDLSSLIKLKYGKNQKKVEDKNGKFPIFGTGGLMGYATDFLYDKPSVLIPRKGSISNVYYQQTPFWTVDTLFYTEINENLIIPKYLYYYISRIDLNKYNEGTTIPSLRSDTLNHLKINVPPILYQKQVLKLLSNIDNILKNNNQLNQNLESQAMELFKSIFINFNNIKNEDLIISENGKIPKNYNLIQLKDICKFKKGKKPKISTDQFEKGFSNYLTIDVLSGQDYLYAKDEKGVLINELDILMVMDGASSGKLFYGKDGLLGSTLSKIIVNEKYREIVYQYLKYYEKYIGDNTTGTAIPHTDKGLVLNLKCPMPEDISEISHIFKTIRLKIIRNNAENEVLSKIRDTLLPRLMSGEIDVSKIEI